MIWVLASTNSNQQAKKIGTAVLKKRLAACFGIYPKSSAYFWPPKSNRLEFSKGPMLILDTLPKHYQAASKLIKKLHSDQVPFIGKIVIDEVNKDFYNWLKGEVKR